MFDILRHEFVRSVETVTGGVVEFVPKVIAAGVLVVIGMLFGAAVGKVVQQIVAIIKADEWLAKAGVARFVERAGYQLDAGEFFGWLAKIFFVIIFLMVAFEVLGLSEVNAFLNQVLAYIPRVVVAAIILLIASIAADLLGGVIAGTTKALGSHVAHLLGSVTRWSIWMFAGIMGLSELGIAPQYMYTLFAGLVAMLALAGGLAFGLGGKDAAAETIRGIREDIRMRK
jgi:hypothetical protein